MDLIYAIAYQLARGVIAAVLEHLPEIRAAWERRATDAEQPDQADQVNNAIRSAIDSGDAPGDRR